MTKKKACHEHSAAAPRFIGARYRLALIGRFAGFTFLGLMLCGALLLLTLNRRLGIGYAEDLSTLSRLHEALPGLLLVAGVIQIAGIALLGLFLSLCWTHAVSGPIVRVRRTLQALASGQASEALQFRATDQLHGLADAFQRLIAAEQRKREAVESSLKEAERLIRPSGQASAALPAARDARDARAALKRVYEGLSQRFTHEAER